MIICISGLTGSGKTTTGEKLAKLLGIRHVSRSYKEYVHGNEELIKFLKEAPDDFVRKFDSGIRKEAESSDSVVTSWLGPWLIKRSSLNVLLKAGIGERANRVAKAKGMGHKEALRYVKEKDMCFTEEVKRVYGIDITKESGLFDIEINTERTPQDEIVSLLALASVEKNKKIFG